jgi:transcription-repair coupling factor (superfamily II helicase)
MAALARALTFFAPEIAVMEFPSWDCLPYDRVSPHAVVVAQRMVALSRLARAKGHDRPWVLLTTVNAALQRVPARAVVATQSLSAAPGNLIDMTSITGWLELNGFSRASTVREPGDYAVRGGIIDLYAPGMAEPVRLDFFGDTLETIRSFDPETQRTTDQLRGLDLVPVAEFQLTSAHQALRRLCRSLRRADTRRPARPSGPTSSRHGTLAAAVPSADGTIFDYVPGSPVVLSRCSTMPRERLGQIEDYCKRAQAWCARIRTALSAAAGEQAHLAPDEWRDGSTPRHWRGSRRSDCPRQAR